jgi:hypothetical protein
MKVRATLPLIISAAILAASGCCNPYVYRGCDPCGPTGCGPCEEVVTCRLPAPCVDDCGKGAACGDCGDCGSACGGYGYGWYPGKHLMEWLTCGAGCGGVYVNEWCNDPPDCCDPCSPCGGYTGGGACCVPLHVKFWAAILGEPCCEPYLPTLDFVGGCCPEPCCGAPGCGGGCGGGEEVIWEKGGEPMMPGPRVVPGSPADEKTDAIPVPEPAPTRATSGKIAKGRHLNRRVYYPHGRIRSR